jgi:hypothetical protein
MTEHEQEGRHRDRVAVLWRLFDAEDLLRQTGRSDPEWLERSDLVRLLSEEAFGTDLEVAPGNDDVERGKD